MLPFLVTVLTCVFWTLEYGMVVGIVFNALFLLYKSMKPQFNLQTQKVRVVNWHRGFLNLPWYTPSSMASR